MQPSLKVICTPFEMIFMPNISISSYLVYYIEISGQWGIPIFTLRGFLVILSGTFGSIVESIGDYYAYARICQVPPPPAHAVNRGITMEGLAGVVSGLFGCGGNTTSYSQNIGAIGMTKVSIIRSYILQWPHILQFN